MSKVIYLKQLNKLVELPDGVQCKLVWARKVFTNNNIYELSLERLDGGYTMWYAELIDKEFKWISCSLYMTIETLAIRSAENLV